jgi:hypothetical protein
MRELGCCGAETAPRTCYYLLPLMRSEAELVAARLARMKGLIESLEQVCACSDNEKEKFVKVKAELQAARAELEVINPPGRSATRRNLPRKL